MLQILLVQCYSLFMIFFFNKEKIEEPKKLFLIFNFLGFFIILICSLIYNEIIICNFCNLNKNTIKSINERQKRELSFLRKDEDNESTQS